MVRKGDILLAVLESGENDEIANELLTEFFRGYPVERLAGLLESKQDEVVKAGAWIASELGAKAQPLVNNLVRLLSHPLQYVRFFVVDSLFQCAGVERGDVIANAIQSIDDPQSGVRWKVMDRVARANRELLIVASEHLPRDFVEPPLAALLTADARQLRKLLRGGGRQRRLAAAIAGRLALHGDTTLVREVTETGDKELSQFSHDILEYIQIARGS